MRVASELSRTEDAGLAAAEAADAAGARLDEDVDLAVVLVSGEHAEGLASAAAAVEARLEPKVLLGAAASGVIGGGEEIEAGDAVVVWCADLGPGRAVPFRAWTVRPPQGGIAVAGWPDTEPGDTTLVIADPYTFPMTEVARRIGRDRPGQAIMGGLCSAGPDRTRLHLDGQVHEDGAVGVVLQDVGLTPVLSQGCRPVGEPMTVTAADRNRVQQLAGEPASRALQRLLREVQPDERELLLHGGLQLGIVVDEVRDEYRSGDFLVRGIQGVDPDDGAITIGDLVEVGATVQFHVRDAASASDDLEQRLAAVGPGAGALLFTCTGRGRALFGEADHDVDRVARAVGGPVAGAFCAGELGPVGARSHLHALSASVLVFGDQS